MFRSSCALAQNETNNWYFGHNAALNFNTPTPSILNNNVMQTQAGCSSISDASGNLLFYSDGATIWNSAHQIMANGSGLLGHPNTTQPALIIKQPGNFSIYYVFTTDIQGGPNGFRYSIVDMALAAGMGSVTTKNSLIYSNASEKLAAVNHCDGNNIWITSHEFNTNTFRSYLLSSTGINPTATISSVGSIHTGSLSNLCQMKFSPNGRKLCIATLPFTLNPNMELFDFDVLNGTVSNLLPLNYSVAGIIKAIEFSNDGTKLYGVVNLGYDRIIQWDLCAANDTAVQNSPIEIGTNGSSIFSMQLASNGKIYVAPLNQSYLGLINFPNQLGAACNYTFSGQSIGTGTCLFGLPAFNASYFYQPEQLHSIKITTTTACAEVNFSVEGCKHASKKIQNAYWNFGDISSGSANTSTLLSQNHVFSSNGTFTVSLILDYGCSFDTLFDTVSVFFTYPTVSVTGKDSICIGESANYSFSGGSTYSLNGIPTTNSSSLSPSITTNYTLSGKAANNPCLGELQFTIHVLPCTGFNEISLTNYNEINVFPNPVDQHLLVALNGSYSNCLIQIFDTMGRIQNQIQIKPENGRIEIDLGKLLKGIYFLSVKSDNQPDFYTKIIKN